MLQILPINRKTDVYIFHVRQQKYNKARCVSNYFIWADDPVENREGRLTYDDNHTCANRMY